jgi:hypothetical protein
VAQRENICHETRKDLSSHHRSNSSTGNFMRRLYRSGGRLEKVLTSSRMNVGHSEEPLVGKPASTSGRIDAVKIYCPCISFTLFFRGSFYLDNYKMSSLMNVSQFSLP